MKKHPLVEQLAQERRSSGMHLSDLSHQIGRCQSLMEKYEYGARLPTFHVMLMWADALGYEVTLKKKEGFELPKKPIKITTKSCLGCGEIFCLKKNDSPGRFSKRKYCSQKCGGGDAKWRGNGQ